MVKNSNLHMRYTVNRTKSLAEGAVTGFTVNTYDPSKVEKEAPTQRGGQK